MATEAEKRERAAAISSALDQIVKQHGEPAKKAPLSAHKALDALLATDRDPNRGAPGWAHDLLDFVWDLLF